MTARQRRVQRRSRKKRGSIFLGLGVLAAFVAIGVLSLGIWVLGVAAQAPPIEDLTPIDKGANSEVYAGDGTRLGVIASDIVRNPVSLNAIPDQVRQATISIEDANFYTHSGVDFGAILRAAVKDVEAGSTVQGGSTITQQLIKNLYTGQLDDRNLEDKIKEAKLAEDLENEYTKDEILEQYLNSASYGTNGGRTAIGVDAAARIYFSKRVGDLSLSESALIAGLPQAPSDYNPLLNPKGAKQRRNEVLAAMADQGYISQSEANQAFSAPLGVNPTSKYDRVKERYFFDYVTEQLIEKYGPSTVRQGGLKVYTTIDPSLQEEARAAMAGQLNLSTDPSSAIVTIDPANGHILAMASSSSYDDREFNLAAQGQRQPGSSFKTMVLTAAIRRGVDPDSTYYTSKPLVIDDPTYGHWEVSTYGDTYSGTMDLRSATLASDNTVYAQLDLDLGPDWVKQTAEDMGITSPLDGLPAEGLGGLYIGVTPLEMADAYATLASGGVHHDPTAITKVVFPDGQTETPGDDGGNRAFSDGVAYEVTDVLTDNVLAGTGTAAGYGCPAAGKTGTTDGFRDAWFVGYTPDLATSVWVGYPDEQISMSSVHGISVAGGTFPARIWHDYMSVAHGTDCNGFPQPQDPFQPRPFFGKYSQSAYEAKKATSTTTTTTTTPSAAPVGDPGAYAPGIQNESDIPGSANGHSGGNGNG